MNLGEFAEKLAAIDKADLAIKALRCRGDILTMTTLSGSGHPGGSMSSIDLLLALYAAANITPKNINDPLRDRVVVSNGHISPAVYSCLAANGFIGRDEVLSQFRKAGSPYEGHIERFVPGVEWTTGNLGQGLSVGCGMAVAGRASGNDFDVYVFMGDGEQQKGQISEARRFAKKYGFGNVTVIIDYNELQISGNIHNVMPSLDIAASFKSDGWLVLEVDGHNFSDIFGALMKAKSSSEPVMILANTVMGKGVSFMENNCSYHGSVLNAEQYEEAMKELKLTSEIDKYRALRSAFKPERRSGDITPIYNVLTGEPETYGADVKTDNRSAFGKALESMVSLNMNGGTPVVVFDCDLASSVKTAAVEKKYPDHFYQCGIAEHHAAVCAGAASIGGAVSFFADFGMFGVDEVYNQQRLNGINEAALKLVTTHVGTDVGEDGKTHMCIDYIALMRNIHGFKIIVPADPNQTDRAVRFAAKEKGNVYVAMGRSKLPVITDESGAPFFAGDYVFRYGAADVVREGEYPIFTYGVMLHRALKIRDILAGKGISVAVVNVSSPAYIENIASVLKSKIAFVYEDHISSGGLFSTLAEKIVSDGINCKLVPFGVNGVPCSGTPNEVLSLFGLDEESVAAKIIKAVGA